MIFLRNESSYPGVIERIERQQRLIAEATWYAVTKLDIGACELLWKENAMHYTVLVARGQSKAEQLADAICGKYKAATVYVIGMDDAEAFAQVLTDGVIEVDSDLDAKMALKLKYTHAIGVEDERTPLTYLVSAAKNLVEEITKAGGHEEYNALMRRFGARS